MIRNSFHRPGFLTLAFAVYLGAPAAEASVKKDALDQLETSAQSSLKTFKSVMKAREGQLKQVLDGIDVELKNGTATTSDAYALYQELADFQLDIKDEIYEAYDQMGTGLHQGLALLHGAGVDPADHPIGFRYGEPGPLDDFRFGLEQLLNDRYEKIRKRIAKIAKKMAKKADVGLTVRIVPPVESRERSPSAFSTGSYSIAVDLTIDLLLAYSDLTQDGDGVVLASGSAYEGSNLTLSRGMANGFNNYFDIIANADDRWSYQVTGLQESNYRFRITPKDNGAYSHSAIGIR